MQARDGAAQQEKPTVCRPGRPRRDHARDAPPAPREVPPREAPASAPGEAAGVPVEPSDPAPGRQGSTQAWGGNQGVPGTPALGTPGCRAAAVHCEEGRGPRRTGHLQACGAGHRGEAAPAGRPGARRGQSQSQGRRGEGRGGRGTGRGPGGERDGPRPDAQTAPGALSPAAPAQPCPGTRSPSEASGPGAGMLCPLPHHAQTERLLHAHSPSTD